MSTPCIATVAAGDPCRYSSSQEVRSRPVCGVHGNMARAWLARGDLPSWWLSAKDYGEQQAFTPEQLDEATTVAVVEVIR